LWHKIFGSPTDQTAKLADEDAPRDAAVSPSDFRDEPRSAGSGFADAHADEAMPMDEEEGEFGRNAEGRGTMDEERPRDETRGRRRRRGGRGRGRKLEDRRPEGRTSERSREEEPSRASSEGDDDFDDEPLLDDDTEDSLDDDLVDDEGNGDEVVSSEGGSRRGSVLQRSIPSWDEAIGFIVDTNMQTRAQRRPPSRSGGRDNSSRGRSRGRRKS
jgi:ribonuclease E